MLVCVLCVAVQTLDLIILAGYYGHGSRGGKLSNFLLGVAEKPLDAQSRIENAKFRTFCKVGTGYSTVELSELVDKLMEHAKPFVGWMFAFVFVNFDMMWSFRHLLIMC